MSSNTLRGIGQEEGGDDEVASPAAKGENAGALKGEITGEINEISGSSPRQGGDGAVVAGAAGSDRTERTEEPSAAASERQQDLRKIRSLDSTVPGTRSLDSSVPEAPPSLDAKVPALASTLLGVPAPMVGDATNAPRMFGQLNRQLDRDAGTIQGRDVHLPLEAQRRAGVRAVADSVAGPGDARPLQVEAAPQSIDRSEPTLADPVKTAALAHAAGAGERLRGNAHADLNSHGPWYDQDPTGGHTVYDEPKPNVLGRAAIGVAVAAALSVVVFAVIRVRAVSGDERDSNRSGSASYRHAFQPPAGQPAAGALPPPPASSAAPFEAPGSSSAPRREVAGERPIAGDLPPRSARPGEQPGQGADPGFDSPRMPAPSARAGDGDGLAARRAKLPAATSRPLAARSTAGVAPRAVPRIGDATTGQPPITRPPLSNDLAPTTLTPPPAPVTPPPLARTAPETPPAVVPAGISGKANGPEKTRGKSKEDPDSTLPLNID